jgi:hypothetical protein
MTTKNYKAQWLRDNLKKGEVYAGLILGTDGVPDHHLIVIPGEAEKVTFAEAQKWAKKQGGDLPTRREQRVLFANAKEAFQPDWYWSGEPYASDASFAWCQSFGNGGQINTRVITQCRARAVRRLIID